MKKYCGMTLSALLTSSFIQESALAVENQFFSEISFESSPLNVEIILDGKSPILFKPFTLDDFCKEFDSSGVCLVRWTPREIAEKAGIDLSLGGPTLYSGNLEGLVHEFNKMEEKLSQRGVSLRDQFESLDYSQLPVEVSRIRGEILSKIGAVTSVLPKVKDPLVGDECPLIPIDLIKSVPNDSVELTGGVTVSIRSASLSINQAQKALCSIGYSITELQLPFVSSEPSEWKERIKNAVDEKLAILSELGISRYSDIFSNLDFEELASYADVAQDVVSIFQNGNLPGPEQIDSLRDKLNTTLPEEYQIPRLPQISIPDYPVRKDWALRKQKVWDMRFGNPAQLSVGADASLDIRGSTSKNQQYTAKAEIACSVFGNHISYLKAQGQATIQPHEMEINLGAYMLGEAIFKPVSRKENVSFRFDNGESPIIWKPKNELAYEQVFTIGPVPAYVAIRADLQIGYTYYLMGNLLNVSGEVKPFAQGAVTGELAIGIRNILSAGVEGNVNLIHISYPLSGSADLRFLPGGEPQMTLKLNADSEYNVLNGHISAYVEYPDWKKLFMGSKRANHTIFSFPGTQFGSKIMDYKMVLGPTGTKLSGSLIDKSDADESNTLDAQILLDERKKRLNEYEIEVAQLHKKIWGVIESDLSSDKNIRVGSLSQTAEDYQQQAANNSSILAGSIAQAGRL